MATKLKTAAGPRPDLDALEAKPLGMVALEDLHDSPFNPRRRYDGKGLEELADSYRLCPSAIPDLLARPRPNGGKGVELIFGHRRKRAAKLAGLTELPVRLVDVDGHVARALQWAENATREALHPLDEADSFAAWLREPGTTVEAIASEIGRPPAFVRSRVKLASLPPGARSAVDDGRLGLGHAALIAGLASAEDQARALEHALTESYDGTRPSVRTLAKWIETELTLDLARAPWQLDDGALVLTAGACSDCPKRSGATADLFAGALTGDRCLDKACWAEKLKAHMVERKNAGEAVLEITEAHGSTVRKPTDPLPRGCYVEVKTTPDEHDLRELRREVKFELEPPQDLDEDKMDEWEPSAAEVEKAVERRLAEEFGACEFARQAVVKKGKAKGDVRLVCTEPKCPKHGDSIRKPTIQASSSSSSEPRVDYEAERKKREAEAERLRKVRGRVLLEVLARVKLEKGHLAKPELLELVQYDDWCMRQIAGHIGEWGKIKKPGELTLEKLSLYLLVTRFSREVAFDQGNRLLGVARRLKVDVKAIEKAVAAEEKGEAPAKKAPAKKKAAAKKR
jgi:ParB family chromosome partitioning protein